MRSSTYLAFDGLTPLSMLEAAVVVVWRDILRPFTMSAISFVGFLSLVPVCYFLKTPSGSSLDITAPNKSSFFSSVEAKTSFCLFEESI